MIYGTIITTATMIAAAEGSHDEREIAATVLVTLVVYWLAHSYAVALGSAHGATPVWTVAVHQLAAESPIVLACILPLAALLLASAFGASFAVSTTIAVWVGVALMFFWGLQASRRLHLTLVARLVSAAAFGLLGLGIIVLRVLFVH